VGGGVAFMLMRRRSAGGAPVTDMPPAGVPATPPPTPVDTPATPPPAPEPLVPGPTPPIGD
jgi:hypothetical protein